MSIETLAAKWEAKSSLPVLFDENQEYNTYIQNAPFYKAPGNGYQWILLLGSDDGVLPGSRNKTYFS